MWETIELREIRIFLALARELHFRRTAERLHVSQSRVSESLRELETKLGVELVARSSRRVALTEAGEELLESLAPAIATLDAALSQAVAQRGTLSGTLIVGVVSAPSGGPRFSEIVQRFDERYPACRLVVRDIAISEGLAPLRSGSVHVAAVRLPLEQDDIAVGPVLSDEARVVVVHRSHRLAAQDRVRVEDLAGERVAALPGLPPETAEVIVPTQTPAGAPLERHPHAPATIVELLGMVGRGEIVHLTSERLLAHVSHPDVVQVPVTDLPGSRTALAWMKDRVDPRTQAFVAIAREVLGGQPAGSV